MFRKTALASALVGALVSGNALALGLGEIEAKSALNQPFDAEVTLLSATDDELNELKVELASNDAFARAGIDRSLFLTHLNFAVSRNSTGQPVIRVTSRDAVTEPFLDFLIEVTWSRGRLLREYTVLIDPPVTMPAAPVIAEAPRRSTVGSADQMVDRPVPRTQAGAARGGASNPSEYGPTQRNDTLWRIAEQVRPDDGVSIEQTMLAMLRANPEAFVDNNINNLKAGQVLRIPGRDEMTHLSQSEARNEARSQYESWRTARGLSSSGVAGVAESGTSGATQSAEDKPSLQLLAPEAADVPGATGATGSAEVEALRRDLVLANEALEAQRLEAADANSRLLVLEEQIQNMRRLIDLKDSELARLQAMAGDAQAQSQPESVSVEQQVAASGESDSESKPEPTAEAEVVSPVAEAPDAEAAAGTGTTAAEATEETAPTPLTVPSEAADGQDTRAEGTSDTAEPTDHAGESLLTTLLAKVTGNPVWLGVGGALLLLLAMFGLRRKQAADDSDFQESILRSPQDEDQLDEGVSGLDQPATETPQGAQSSLLSEFAVSDMVSADGESSADPLAEADVYLAYGRYQQAADLVKEGLETEPDREDLNLKLLEIYQAAGLDEEFDKHAQDLLQRLGDRQHPVWQRVSEMGVAVNPRNPLYTLGAAVDVTADTLDTGWTESATDQPRDFMVQREVSDVHDAFDEIAPAADAGSELDDNALEFDLDGFDLGDDGEEDHQSGDGELADLDEVSTKLDLARAYIDMGDSDGARSILDEVIEEGNEEQKSEAHDILQRLAS